jgi:acetyl-CoA synthetase
MKNIETFEEYQKVYQKSIDDPETFWAEVADSFVWKKNGIRYYNGTSLNLR